MTPLVHARTTVAYLTSLLGLFVSKIAGSILSHSLR